MSVNPEHITIIRSGAIGDFVLTLPAVNALQLAYPRSRLRLIGNPSILRLGPVRELIDINSAEIAGLYNPEGAVPERTRALFAGVDLLLAYAVDPDRRLQARLSEIVRGRAIVFDPRPKRNTHIAEHLLAPLHRISVPVSDPIPRIPLNEGLNWITPAGSFKENVCLRPWSPSTRAAAAGESAGRCRPI